MWKINRKTCKFNLFAAHKLYSLPTRVYNFPPKCTIFPLRCLCLCFYWCWCWWLWTPCQEEMLLLCGGEMPEEEWEVVEKYRWHQTRTDQTPQYGFQTSNVMHICKKLFAFSSFIALFGVDFQYWPTDWETSLKQKVWSKLWRKKFRLRDALI